MMKILKTAGLISLIVFLLLLIVTVLWAVWERNRNPLNAINLYQGSAPVVRDSVIVTTDTTRHYHSILLKTKKSGNIQAYLSLPASLADERLPVIIILGGLNIGIKNFEMIPEPGNNAILIYDYPYSPQYWYDGTAVTEIPVIRSAVLQVPSQVLELANWANEQDWADKRGCSVLGYSFGALFVPAVYNLAGAEMLQFQPGVIAYGGADINQLLKTNLRKVPEPLKSGIAWLASTAIYTADPLLHAPNMRNEFLVINSLNDKQISDYSWLKLHELIPEPKTIVILNEGHMHPRKPDLTQKLVGISKDWLMGRGVINP